MSLFPNVIGQHFAFGHGRLSVLMNLLMRQSDVDRFLGSPDAATAKRMLDDVHFVELAAEGETTEHILADAIRNARSICANLVPASKKELLSLPLLATDFALVSFLLKEKKGFVSDAIKRPSSDGVTAYPVTEIEKAVNGDASAMLPKELEREIAAILKEEVTAKEIDTRLAKTEASVKLRIAKKQGSALIVRFIRHSIDLTNVRSYLRSEDRDAFKNDFIRGGFLPLTAFTGDRVDFRIALANSRYGFAMKGRMQALEKGEWVELEQAVAQVRMTDIRDMWNRTLGAEPVFAYIVTVIDQINLLRAIMIGKQGNLSPQEMKRVIPPLLTAVHYGS